jgi:hypothetical protein
MIPSLEAVMTSGQAIRMSEGTSLVLKYPPEQLIYKVLQESPSLLQGAKKVKRMLGRQLRKYIHLTSYIDESESIDPALEINVVTKWRAHGIPTPLLLDRQPNATVYQCINGNSLHQVLNSPRYQREAFQALLETFHLMRSLAYEYQDPYLLHTDAHLKNFLWDEENSKALAIDPNPQSLKPLPLPTIDALLSLRILYDLCSVVPAHTNRYLEEFAQTFSPSERSLMVENNIPLPHMVVNIHQFYGAIIGRLGGPKETALLKFYSRKNTDRLNSILRD